MMRSILCLFFLTAFLTGFSQNTWTNGGATGVWNDPLNWSTGFVPGSIGNAAADNIVIFDGTSTADCSIDDNADLTGSISISSFSINSGYTGIITCNYAIILSSGAFTQNAGTFDLNGLAYTISGNFTLSAGTFIGTGTITLNCSAANRTITGSPTFNNLTISAGSTANRTLTVSNSPVISGTLSFTGSKNMTVLTGTVNLQGTISTGGIGTRTFSTATLNLNGTTSQTFTPSTFIFSNVTSNNTSSNGVSLGGNITSSNVTGNFSVNSGTFDQSSFSVTLAINKSFTLASSSTFKIGGSCTTCLPTVSGTGTVSIASGSTVEYYGTLAQTVKGATYSNLIISGARAANNVTLENGGNIKVSATFNPNATFSGGAYVITGSKITFNGTSQTIPAFNFNKLEINCTSASSTNGPVNVADSLILRNGVLTVGNTNTFNVYGLVAQISGSFSYATSATVSFDMVGNGQLIPFGIYYNLGFTGGTKILSPTGIIKVANNYTPSTASHTITGSTIEFNGTSTQTIPAFTYNNISFSSTGTKNLPSTGNLIVNGDFTNTVTSGSVAHNNGTITFSKTSGTQNLTGSTSLYYVRKNNSSTFIITSGGSNVLSIVQNLVINAGTITTNGNLTIKSGSDNITAGIIDSASTAGSGGSISGNVIVERFARASTTYGHYFTSPIISGTTSSIVQSPYNVLQYNEDTNRVFGNHTVSGSWKRAGNSITMTVGKGYSTKHPADITHLFTGVVNNGSINVNLTRTVAQYTLASDAGWNLVGNPYPSAIQWSTVGKTNLQGVNLAYTFNSGTGSYEFVNNSGSSPIESGRAFFVQVGSGTTGSLAFTNSNRRLTNVTYNVDFSRLATNDGDLYFQLDQYRSGDTLTDKGLIRLIEGAKDGFDIYDGRKLFGFGSVADIYTYVNNENLVFNSIPTPTSQTVIPIGMKKLVAGRTYNFKATTLDQFDASLDVYIKDNGAGGTKLYNLRNSNGEYTFTPQSLSDTLGRFSLVISPVTITGIEDVKTLTEQLETVKAFTSEGQVFVNFNELKNQSTNITLVDGLGKQIFVENGIQTSIGTFSKSIGDLKAGVYFVRVSSNASIITKKIIIQ